MVETQEIKPNTFFVEVSGSGLPEVDGLFVPSTAPPARSESDMISSPGYWNGKMAWDRADGKGARSPSISYSNTYRSWRISRLDGHLAYHVTGDDEMPPTNREWETYRMGVAPAPRIVLHLRDPRLPRPKPHVVFVLGGPGAGKGTMCELAESQLGWTHLSAGALLRKEREAGGPNAALIEEIVTAGKLVPAEITVGLLKNAMDHVGQTTGKNNFLVDGFPRSLSNLEGWYAVFGREAELPGMVYFECPYPVLEKRILRRAKYTGRLDDNVESMKLRFDTFKAETLPIVELFRSKGRCVDIDTSQDRETVYRLFRGHLAEHTGSQLAARPLPEHAPALGPRPYDCTKSPAG
ncbi:MAG: nucleoside monophosphate kinase [Polaromonas sp.]|uniref:nucleoside monophosphate kinase n=1 Tax=Polaromonas sp. TaxID=1869339 RepID=UPI00273119C6|nr:nucleoside monophosphate kinase [Polaromonas sp.]MDP2451085.1 nucleoside monophosphate kinase [Polaromonas sp.]MDP3246645.1 nucleoside monophosphate kinase [Polaromonas sp.]MDP3753925.1 nucleoside monophosphate kinase [Polaromonas sp.]